MDYLLFINNTMGISQHSDLSNLLVDTYFRRAHILLDCDQKKYVTQKLSQ